MAESLDGADTSVLPEEDLEEENGESGREQHEEVRDLEFERFLPGSNPVGSHSSFCDTFSTQLKGEESVARTRPCVQGEPACMRDHAT